MFAVVTLCSAACAGNGSAPGPLTGREVDSNPYRFSFSAPLMGTDFTIVIYAADSVDASTAAASAFDLADSLEAIMSDYRPGSELNRLSKTAGTDSLVSVSEPLARVLIDARIISESTNGAFDVTTGALTRLWRRGFRRGEVPSASDIARARSTVDYRNVVFGLGNRGVRLTLHGTRLDLGGIAKGFAADRMLDQLRDNGFDSALVDAGGDIAAGEPPPGTPGWTISIQAPDEAGVTVDEAGKLVLSNAAIATSGDRFRFVEKDGRRYSHIIDPVSGYGVTHTRSVTVIAPSATRADAFASAFSVMPVEKAIDTAESHPNLEARILSRTDSSDVAVLRKTTGFPAPPA